MQYLIMLVIVLGLAIVDFLFGFFKACVTKSVSSSKMRRGGISKLCEIIIMATTCGLEIAIQALGQYYSSGLMETFTKIMGVIAALAVCGYITLMEIVSIFENFVVINPKAKWAKSILKVLKAVKNEEEEKSNGKKRN